MHFPNDSKRIALALGLVTQLTLGCGEAAGPHASGDGDSVGDGDGHGGSGDDSGATGGDGDAAEDGDDAGAGGDGDVDWPVVEGAYDLEVSRDPLKATLTYDEAHRVSQRIEFTGGSLSTTTSDGTTYVLTIPPEAMPYPALITMTPLATLEGLPFAGEPHGVRLDPEGFTFVAPVTLEVVPKAGTVWPPERQIPLSIQGEAGLVSLGLLEPAKAAATFSLSHFSAYTLLLSQKGMNATLTEAQVRSRFGGDEATRLESAVAEILARERQRQLLGMDDGDVQIEVDALTEQFEERVVKLRMDKAGESCAAAQLATQTLLGAERQRQLMSKPSSKYIGELDGLIQKGTLVCLEEEYEICRDEHIVTRILPVYIGSLRQLLLLGFNPEDPLSWPSWWGEAEEYVKKCLSFELAFDSSVNYHSDYDNITMSETVSGRARVQYQLNTIMAQGQLPPAADRTLALITGDFSPLSATGYDVGDSDLCDFIDSETAQNGQLAVALLTWTAGDSTKEDPEGNLYLKDVGVSIAFNPNLSQYAYTRKYKGPASCEEIIDSGSEPLSWSTTLGAELLSEYVDEEGNGALIQGFLTANADILASKTFTFGYQDDQVDIEGPLNLVLFHKPE